MLIDAALDNGEFLLLSLFADQGKTVVRTLASAVTYSLGIAGSARVLTVRRVPVTPSDRTAVLISMGQPGGRDESSYPRHGCSSSLFLI